MNNTGFLKRAQKFRSNVANEDYFPILDSMHIVASKHHNNLPSNFELEKIYGFSSEDVEIVLSKLYPDRKYCCKLVRNQFFCSL